MTLLMLRLRAVSIRWKLLGAFLLVVLGLVVVAGAAVEFQLSAARRAAFATAESLASEVARVSDENDAGAAQTLQQYITMLGKLYKRNIFVVNRMSVVVASANLKEVGSVYINSAVEQTIASGSSRAFEGQSVSDGSMTREIAVTLPPLAGSVDRLNRGALVFEYTQVYDTMMAETERAASMTVAAALLLGGLGALLALRVSHTTVMPLASIVKAAREIAEDNYRVRVPVGPRDEVGQVAEAFNHMADDLSRNRAALEDRNRALAVSNAQLAQGLQAQKEAAARIAHMAYHDALTGLANRPSFSLVLEQALERARRGRHQVGVLFLDLDRFKQINDTLGHATGDVLLQEVGRRLRQTLRASDVVARLGGDEFVVLVDELRDDFHAATVAHKILTSIARPLQVPGQELRVGASIGISRFPQDGADEQTLMKNADIAMYQAKEAGRNDFAFYAEERNANSFERLALESSLRRALERGELLLHYQPKRNFRNGAVSGMEALVRWQHPDLGLVPPSQFIPVAEETGLIVPLGKWVLREACRQTMAWHEQGLTDLVIAVNLSARQFRDENLLQDVVDVLVETGIEASRLELEITESAIVQDAGRACAVLRELKNLGVRIAIDDFGTGYSSLSALKQFPIDTLKIDRAFVRDLDTEEESRGLAQAIITMGKALKLHLVAEGVESGAQAEFLRERGCDELQGFHFSQPVAPEAFEAFVRRQRYLAWQLSRPTPLLQMHTQGNDPAEYAVTA